MDWVYLCICSGQIDEMYVIFSRFSAQLAFRMYFGGFCLYFACEALDVCSGFSVKFQKNPRTCAQSVRLRRHAVIGDAPKMRQRQPNEKLLTLGINHGGIGAAAERGRKWMWLRWWRSNQNWFSIVKNVSTTRRKNTTITLIESTLTKLPLKCTVHTHTIIQVEYRDDSSRFVRCIQKPWP